VFGNYLLLLLILLSLLVLENVSYVVQLLKNSVVLVLLMYLIPVLGIVKEVLILLDLVMFKTIPTIQLP
jgi:phage-related holin